MYLRSTDSEEARHARTADATYPTKRTNVPQSNKSILARALDIARRQRAFELRLLVIGDSISQGLAPSSVRSKGAVRNPKHPDDGLCSYRSALIKRLQKGADSVLIRPVGPRNSTWGGPDPTDCDPQPGPHAARWGISAEAVVDVSHYKRPRNASTTNKVLKGQEVFDWVLEGAPQLVTVLLGTNDLAMGTTPSKLLNKYIAPLLRQVLRASARVEAAMNGAKPSSTQCPVEIAVIPLLPRADSIMAQAKAYNDLLAHQAALSSTACGDAGQHVKPDFNSIFCSPCITVLKDLTKTVDGLDAVDESIFYDGLHPSRKGEAIIGNAIANQLLV